MKCHFPLWASFHILKLVAWLLGVVYKLLETWKVTSDNNLILQSKPRHQTFFAPHSTDNVSMLTIAEWQKINRVWIWQATTPDSTSSKGPLRTIQENTKISKVHVNRNIPQTWWPLLSWQWGFISTKVKVHIYKRQPKVSCYTFYMKVFVKYKHN